MFGNYGQYEMVSWHGVTGPYLPVVNLVILLMGLEAGGEVLSGLGTNAWSRFDGCESKDKEGVSITD